MCVCVRMYLPNLQKKPGKNKLESNTNCKQILKTDGGMGENHVTLIVPALQFCLEPAHKQMCIHIHTHIYTRSLHPFCFVLFADLIFFSTLTQLEIESHHKV